MKTYTPDTEVDFVVIGSGAAGGIMAKQLSTAGFSVVVLEQGGWGKFGRDWEYTKDELVNGNPAPADRLMSDPSRQRNTFRRTDKEKAGPGTHAYGCVVGGGTVTYGGSSWRHLPWEFNEKSHVGAIAGTGLEDWPITYDELEPYYVQAEWEMGISGLRVDSPFVAPMSKDYPVPPVPLKSSGALFEVAAKKLGLTVVPGPLAIITQPYMGRTGCVNCGMCSGFGCHVGARSSSAVTMLPRAVATGNCEIRPWSYVREISVDKKGRVTGAIYFDADKREHFQKAKAVVLSANGSESARLLLLSKSAQVPGRARELERRRRQVPDDRRRRGRERALRARAQRLQGRDLGRRHRRLRAVGSEARLLRRRPAHGARLRHADQLRPERPVAGQRRAGARATRRRCAKRRTTR